MKVSWDWIRSNAKPGDKLKGDLYQLDFVKDSKGEYQEIKRPVDTLVFWDCIGCLTEKDNVRAGAKIFIQDGIEYEIEGT